MKFECYSGLRQEWFHCDCTHSYGCYRLATIRDDWFNEGTLKHKKGDPAPKWPEKKYRHWNLYHNNINIFIL
jgi:hypothetical protein